MRRFEQKVVLAIYREEGEKRLDTSKGLRYKTIKYVDLIGLTGKPEVPCKQFCEVFPVFLFAARL